MKTLKKYTVLLALILVNCSNIIAQNKLEIQAPSYVELGNTFKVIYIYRDTKNSGKPSFSINSNENFTIRNIIPGTSSYSSISIINGKISKTNETDYTWTVYMTAQKEGLLKLPNATAKLPNGTIIKAPEYTINIGNTNNQLPQPQQNQNINQPENINSIGKLALILSLNKKNVYIGEPITAILKLYSQYEIQITDFKPTTYNGFWTQDIEQINNVVSKQQIINGKKYITAILEKKLLFPQKTGQLQIAPYYLQLQIYDFWGFPAGLKDLYSNSPIVIVKPLPENNKPSDFTGAVGNFKINIETSADTVPIDRPYTIKITLTGNGNFGLFDDPQIKVPPSFEQLQPNITENLSPTINGITGSKTYEYTYVPRSPGKYTIQPISFSFFNPKEKKYITLQTKSIPVVVIGIKDTNATYTSPSQQAMEQIAKDIHYIYKRPFKLHKIIYCYKRDVFILSYLILLLSTLLFIYWKREQIKKAADIRKQKFYKADKITKKHLKTAYKYLKNNKLNEFYQAIDLALSDYISNKLDIPKSELSLETIKQKLLENNIDPEIAQLYVNIIKDSQTARFAPEISNIDPNQIINSAKKVIAEIDKNFKSVKK